VLRDRVIFSSRRKSLGILLASIAFVIVGLWMVRVAASPQGNGSFFYVLGSITTLFFGLGIGVALLQLLVPNQLCLSSDNLTIKLVFHRPLALAWRDIATFFVLSAHGAGRLVAYRFIDALRPTDEFGQTPLTSYDATLPPGWRMEPKALADLLEEYRRAAHGE